MINNLMSTRVCLRELKEEDWMEVHKYASLTKVCQFQPWGPNSEDETKIFVEQVLVDAHKEPMTQEILDHRRY